MTLGEALRRYRAKNHLLQKEAADHFGISRKHYAQLERDRELPSLKLLNDICKRLGYQIELVSIPPDNSNEGES
jgi:DNA-binding XRE family transcriptional regulator